MPCYDFKCSNCGLVRENVYVQNIEKEDDFIDRKCTECGGALVRQFPNSIHTSIDESFDGTDPGKATKEKNEQVKKKWAGYEHENQNLRKKITEMVEKKVK